MLIRKGLVLFLSLASLTVCPQAQESAPQNAVDAVPDAQRMPVPPVMSSEGSPLAFSSELARKNYLTGGVSVGSTFDDNALNTNTNPVSDFSYSILPHIALQQSLGRLDWALNYTAGFVANQRLSARNQGSHDLSLDMHYRLTPHVNLSVRDHFYITTNFFDQLNQNAAVPTAGVLQRPNQSLVTPLAKQTGNDGSAGVSYQFSSSSMIGASGTFYQSHYRDAPASSGLVGTHSEGAQAFYNHRISARNSIGVTYRFQRFTFSPISDETVLHSVVYVHTITLKPTMTLSVFAGPQFSDTRTRVVAELIVLPVVYLVSVPIENQMKSVTGGASFGWNGEHTGVSADFVHTINDGGGLLGPVQLKSIDAAIRRQLTRSLTMAFGVVYATNDALRASSFPQSSFKTASGSMAMEQRLPNQLFLRLGYAHDYQQRYGSGLSANNFDHNRSWVSISYDFARPLGR